MPTPTVDPPVPELLEAARRAAAGERAGADEALFGTPLSAWRRRTRAELGMPEHGAVIGTGHQPAFWHPGIVVKSMLAAELAATVGGAAFHAVVEQDTDSPTALSVPVRDDAGSLRAVSIDLAQNFRRGAGVDDGAPGIAVERMPAFDPPMRASLPPSMRPALPSVESGLERMLAALRNRRGEPSAPMQVTRAALDLLGGALASIQVVRSASFLDTTLARTLLGHMAADPERCAVAYNRAVAGVPGAATALAIHDDRVEIPLWRLDEEGHRMRAWADDLERAAGGAGSIVLRPRALLLTALMRLGPCDLFVHGTGGAAYDVAMERWLLDWLGVHVAPSATATASMHLPFPEGEAPRIDLHVAQHALRDARFDPEQGEASTQATTRPGPHKRRLLAAIDAAPRRSFQRRAAWRTLHDELAGMRAEHASSLAACERALEVAQRQARERPIVESRTWPFPFFEPGALESLRATVAKPLHGQVHGKP